MNQITRLIALVIRTFYRIYYTVITKSHYSIIIVTIDFLTLKTIQIINDYVAHFVQISKE